MFLADDVKTCSKCGTEIKRGDIFGIIDVDPAENPEGPKRKPICAVCCMEMPVTKKDDAGR